MRPFWFRLPPLLVLAAGCLAVAAAQARSPAEIEILWERVAPGDGPPTVPALRGDIVYLAAVVRGADGVPIDGVSLEVSSEQGNRLIGPAPVTRDGGYAELNVAARTEGLDRITVRAGDVAADIRLRVRPPTPPEDYAAAVPAIRGIEDITPWATLMAAQIDFDAELRVQARYGERLRSLAGKRLRLAGFMLPLEMGERQHRIILSANPPTCFFHLPGGPTTVAVVELRRPTAVTWDPLVVEGVLEMAEVSDDGIVYRLREAEVLAK